MVNNYKIQIQMQIHGVLKAQGQHWPCGVHLALWVVDLQPSLGVEVNLNWGGHLPLQPLQIRRKKNYKLALPTISNLPLGVRERHRPGSRDSDWTKYTTLPDYLATKHKVGPLQLCQIVWTWGGPSLPPRETQVAVRRSPTLQWKDENVEKLDFNFWGNCQMPFILQFGQGEAKRALQNHNIGWFQARSAFILSLVLFCFHFVVVFFVFIWLLLAPQCGAHSKGAFKDPFEHKLREHLL